MTTNWKAVALDAHQKEHAKQTASLQQQLDQSSSSRCASSSSDSGRASQGSGDGGLRAQKSRPKAAGSELAI
jgi:hypothetical protein